jgi:hypothetical protein
MSTEKWLAATITSLATTELNSLANGSSALGVEYDNATNLYLFGLFELTVTFGTSPTAGKTVDLYVIPTTDGTNYSTTVTGASGYGQSTSYVGSFPLQAVTTLQRLNLGGIGARGTLYLPPVKWKALLINNSGQAFPASGSTLKMVAYQRQSV